MNDDQMYDLILAGNQDGLSILLDKYGGLMSYIARNIGKFTEEDLAECISDTLFTVWKRIKNYDMSKSSFKSWIVLVTRGCTIDYIRKNNRYNDTLFLEDLDGELTCDGKSIDSLDIDKIAELLNKLSPPDNEIFYRRFILGEDVVAISEIMKITKENVYKRITRGRENLRAILIKEGYYV